MFCGNMFLLLWNSHELHRFVPFVYSFFFFISLLLHLILKFYVHRKNDELQKDAVDALCCLAQALGEDFTVFIPSIHKLLLKHRLRVFLLF